ncbi:MAG TPA: hypothetical protein VGJ91_18870 [Polyangiaceae bacterium]
MQNRNERVVSGLIVALCCAVAVGCGGSEDATGIPAQSYQQLELESSGGGLPPCSNGKDSYEVTRVPAHLTWVGCDYAKSPPESVMGDRALSAAELDSVTQALQKVSVSSAKNCGADAGVVTLDLTTNSNVLRYADDFYSGCPWDAQAGRTFVTGLNELAAVLSQLATP